MNDNDEQEDYGRESWINVDTASNRDFSTF